MSNQPCRYCTDKRSIWCHSTCKDYKDARAEKDRENEIKRKQNMIDGALLDIARQGKPKRKGKES